MHPPYSVLLLCLLLAPLAAAGATLHVAPTGSDGGPCSPQAPCRTINGGLARLTGGDTLLVAPGDYHEIISDSRTAIASGSAGAYTTIKAVPGTVRLTATPQGEESSLVSLTSSSSHHIRLEGLVLDGGNSMTNCGVFVHSHDLQIANVDCHHAQGGFIGSSRNVAFVNTASHDHGTNGCRGSGHSTEDGYCHGWYLATMEDNPGPWTFDGVSAYNNNGYGIQTYHTNMVIRNSVFRDNATGGIVGFGGTIGNNCFEGNRVHAILCDGCTLSGNRINEGGCGTPTAAGGPLPTTLPQPPPPAPRPSRLPGLPQSVPRGLPLAASPGVCPGR